jgi:inorganic pyrophosphatase
MFSIPARRASCRYTTSFVKISNTLASQSPTNPSRNAAKIQSRSSLIAQHFSGTTTPSSNMASKFSVRKIAAPNTLEHRIYIEKDGVPISAFHDVPLYANEQQTVLNMIVEIPRWTNAKMEVGISSIGRRMALITLYQISKDEVLNPIKQVRNSVPLTKHYD